MGRKTIVVAIVYDFDGTLSPGNMQEYDFIPQLGMGPIKFWKQVEDKAAQFKADKILTYMHWMIKKAGDEGLSVRKEAFRDYGKGVKLFDGVKPWFKRIDAYGKTHGVRIEHYIVSSGILEMIKGSPVKRSFKKIFASTFVYDNNDVACWPAIAINYTTKTQFLFRINKGCLNLSDDEKINKFVPQEERPIPFERMIYIGDGTTDVPCMKLVKELGGHSIAVYRPRASRARATALIKQGRVHFVLPADYRKDKPLDKVVRLIIQKIQADAKLMDQMKQRRNDVGTSSNHH